MMGCTLNALKSVGRKAKGPTVAHTSTPACIQNLNPLPLECRWSALCHLREARRRSIRHRLDGFIRKRASHRGEGTESHLLESAIVSLEGYVVDFGVPPPVTWPCVVGFATESVCFESAVGTRLPEQESI